MIMREQFKYAFILNLTMGFCLSTLAGALSAAAAPNTITIDVTDPNASVNYNQVDQFFDAQDRATQSKAKVQHLAMDGKSLILSDKPIILADSNKAQYKPQSLSDLGIKFQAGMQAATIVKAAPYMLANKNLIAVPTVPEFNVEQQRMELLSSVLTQFETMVSSAVSSAQQQGNNAPASPPPAKVFMTAASTPEIALKSQLPAQPAALSVHEQPASIMTSIGLAALSLIAIFGLSRLRSRKTKDEVKKSVFSGQIVQATEMVGKGEVFDFNRHLSNGQVIPMNTTYLNMLWKVGKFSNEGAVDTYFYMAYYIPSMRAYAATLQNKKAEIRQKTDA
jgi:hypothetical protein